MEKESSQKRTEENKKSEKDYCITNTEREFGIDTQKKIERHIVKRERQTERQRYSKNCEMTISDT